MSVKAESTKSQQHLLNKHNKRNRKIKLKQNTKVTKCKKDQNTNTTKCKMTKQSLDKIQINKIQMHRNVNAT